MGVKRGSCPCPRPGPIASGCGFVPRCVKEIRCCSLILTRGLFPGVQGQTQPQAGFPGWRGSRAEQSAPYKQGSGGPHPAAICRVASETQAEIRVSRQSSGRSPAGIWLENRTTLHDGCERCKEQTGKCCANSTPAPSCPDSPLQGGRSPGSVVG